MAAPKFRKTFRRLTKLKVVDPSVALNRIGRQGVSALAKATPQDTGETSTMWTYKVSGNLEGATVTWYNNSTEDGIPIVVLLQYGHATRSGRFVSGNDFVNPAMDPIYDNFVNMIRKEIL